MITHNDNQIDVTLSHFQGYVVATYKELVDVFGPPEQGDGYKVDAEWIIKWPNGVVATIYNWKDGKNYCGPEGKEVEDITNWHIGGYNSLSVEYVKMEIGSASL